MALTNCIECGEIVSDKADKCPHCGAPPTKAKAIGDTLQTIGCLGTIFITLPILLLFLGMCG